ncbi:ethylene-insensitive protein 2 [Neltuma alba]|uniref:ethylene-insensitive protein 2 n=1 Tax=Neltuma alba TaxID=207710 RepID=UPI0010A3F506|nr:ethylene-insensitive protein 2-like [Prosopis alba]
MNNKMEAQTMSANQLPSFFHRSLHVVAPMLMISVGYIDPGKWAATVEGGARFGFGLMAFMLFFNFASILCQYISARIGVITGKDLAKICGDEYGARTCIFLGIQTELSVIMLDLNVILGMAHLLNLIFGWDLFTCVLLAAASAAFHLLPAILLDNGKAKVLGLFIAGFVLLFVAFGITINGPEIPVSTSGVLTKLSGESAFVLMSLLGATLVPHNFYLYSSVVQWHQGSVNFSKDATCHNHFLAIFCAFSGIYLIYNMMMGAAANEFHGTGLVLLTLQDALSPMEQVLQSPMALPAFLLFLFISNQATALAWSLGGEVVVHSFLKLDIPGWLHYATIRVIAVLPALYCVWSAGSEGMYQLLVFTQVVAALQLPSSVIPLFRISTSKSIMGVHKISQFVEFLALIVFIGILGLNIIFVVEMIFGSSNWVDYLRWNVGSGMSVLIFTACVLFGFMLWLAITPLKSTSAHLDAQAWNSDEAEATKVSPIESQESDLTETRCHRDASLNVEEPSSTLARDSGTSGLPVTTEEESHSITQLPSPPGYLAKESVSPPNSEALSTVTNEISDAGLATIKTEELEAIAQVKKTAEVEADTNAERDDDDGDSWEAEESSKVATAGAPSSTSDGPGSFRTLSWKSDEGGNSIGSLSRLAGLGRAARRQLATILNDFWGELYDYHGQPTQDAKAKKLDVLSGVDLRFSGSLPKVNASGNDYPEYVASVGSRASDTLMNSGLYDSPKFPRIQSSFESSYGPQRGSSSFRANPTGLLDACVQNSSRKVLDSGERRYSSVRSLPSSEVWDGQPATVHGYQIASYLSRVGRDRIPDNLNGQGKLSSLKSPLTGTNASYRDPYTFASGQKLQNGVGAARPPGFENVRISRNSTLPSETSCYDFCFPGAADSVGSSVNTKKYHSLPDISGYAIPCRGVYASDKNAAFEGSVYGSTRTGYEPLYSNSGSRRGAPLAFDDVSPSKDYRDALSSQLGSDSDTGSLWSKQPFEQFGVAGKIHDMGMEGVGTRPSSISQETASVVDMEVKLQSFRRCILGLLKLEGSDWLFRQNGGVDEDLIDRVAAREKFLYEVETRETNSFNFSVTSVPHCGEGCIWRPDLIISFGVWCIHRILELLLMESRPELWGKYTFVLNRLQGVIDPAFSKPRSVMPPCFCLQIPAAHQQKSSPTFSNGVLPPPPAAKAGRGKFTTASMILELIKDVEIAISGRKGRTGTTAGDVAFPRGKENVASVLKRYKRRLSRQPCGSVEGSGSRRNLSSAPYNNS